MPRFLAFGPSHRVYPIQGLLGCCHLLYDAEQRTAVLLDTGLSGEVRVLGRVLRQLNLDWPAIRAILLRTGNFADGSSRQVRRLSAKVCRAVGGRALALDRA